MRATAMVRILLTMGFLVTLGVSCGDSGGTVPDSDTVLINDTVSQDQTEQDTAVEEESSDPCQDKDDDGYMGGEECTLAVKDCNDTNDTVHPGATEICGNAVDEDCDGEAQECSVGCVDGDSDGYQAKTEACPEGTDCDDNNNTIHPGGTEVCGNQVDEDCDGYDDSCDPCADVDEDGYIGKSDECPTGTDCDDKNNQVHPGAVELCESGIDENCDGTDPACPEVCEDGDQDGYGNGPDCLGYDCNDGNASVHPGATEICGNGIDDDCVDGDEACPNTCEDGDGDGFGVGAACAVQDCQDDNDEIYPGATEICGNGIDEDCSGADKECGCIDGDGDNYGEGVGCAGADCDDTMPNIHPGATEICSNGIDEDCSGADLVCDCVDADGDGYGAGTDCLGPDCVDSNAAVHPGATEICGNGLDDDCSGGDATCTVVNCDDDWDCPAQQLCDASSGQCRYAKVWEWWAPTFYVDTDEAGPMLDLPRTMNFDGDWNAANNAANLAYGNSDAVVYYSFVKTSTHWYLGYYMFFPKRWTTWTLGTSYENTTRGVLVVVEQDGSMYGKVVLVETTTEDGYLQYAPEDTDLTGGNASLEGSYYFDTMFPEDHHPIVYVKSQTHGMYADTDFWAGIDWWELDGFPDGDGVVYRFGSDIQEPMGDNDEVLFDTVSLNENIWTHRYEVGVGQLFDVFGHFNYASKTHTQAVAPWRFIDANYPTQPAGEFLYDPVDLVRRHFSEGWGIFSSHYVYNPYVVKVTLEELGIHEDLDPGISSPSDPYVRLRMYDGAGNAVSVLDNFYGLQNSWYLDGVPVGTTLDMWLELGGRNYFYGFNHPDHDYLGISVMDYDGGWSADEYLMDSGAMEFFSFEGTQILDFGKSDATVTIDSTL